MPDPYGYDRDGDGVGEEVQQGGNRTNMERKDKIENQGQGPKTLAKNREMARKGSPDQGTH